MHVLWRARSGMDLPVLEVLADGTYRSRIADPDAARTMRRRGAGPCDIPGIPVRVTEYTNASQHGTQAPQAFTSVTDICGPGVLSCGQAAACYASRWQLRRALLLPGDPRPDQRCRRGRRHRSPPGLLHRHPRCGPQAVQRPGSLPPPGPDETLAGPALETTLPHNPGAATRERPGEQAAGPRPASTAGPPGRHRSQ